MTSSSIDLRPHFVAARNLHDISVVLKGLRNGVLEFPADKVEKPLESRQHERNANEENSHRQSVQTDTRQEFSTILPSSSSSSARRLAMVNVTLVAEQHVKTESSTSFALPASCIPSLPLQDHGIFPDLYANNNKESIKETIREKMIGSNKTNLHGSAGQNPEMITVMPSLSLSSSSAEQTSEVNAASHSEHCKEREGLVHNNSFREHLEQFTMNGNLEEERKNNNNQIEEHSLQEKKEEQQHGNARGVRSNEIEEHLPTQVLPQLSSMSHELQSNKIHLRNHINNKYSNNDSSSQVKMLCIWDIDDTLVGSGSAGVRQHPVFKYEELRRVFKSVNGPNTRHLLLSQGSIDDILAEDGSSKLGYLREFFDVQHNSESNYANKAKGNNNNSNTNIAHEENSKVHVLCHGSSSSNNVKSSRSTKANGKETKQSEKTNKQNYESKLEEEKQKEKVHTKELVQHKSEVEEDCDGVVEHSSCATTSKKEGNNENSIERQKREQGWFASLFTCKSVEQRCKPLSASSHSHKSTSTPESSSTSPSQPTSSLPVASSLSSSANVNNKNNHTITPLESSTLAHISEDTYLIQLNAIRHNAFYEFDSERLYTYLHNPPPWYSAPHCNSTNSSVNMTQSTNANNGHTHSNHNTECKNSNIDNHHYNHSNNGDDKKNYENRIINNNSSIINDDYSRWLILRPEIWGITLSSLSTPIAPTSHTAFVDGRRFRKMDVVWSLAKSGNWDVVFFVDNSLCETGVTRSGAKLIDLLRYRHGSHMRNFYKAEYILLAASAKLRQMEQRLHRDVTKPISGYERCHASYFHRARMGSFVSANITPSDMVTPAFHTTHVQEQTQEPGQPTPQEEQLHNIHSITNHGTNTQQIANTFISTAINNDNIASCVTGEPVEHSTEITVNNICNSDNRDSKGSLSTSNANGVKEHDAPPSENCEQPEWEREENSKPNTTTCKANEKLLPPVISLKPQTIDASEVVDIASQRSISFSVEVMEYNTNCNDELINTKVNGTTYNSDSSINTHADGNKIKNHNNPLELEESEEELEEEQQVKEEEKDEIEEEEQENQNIPLHNCNVPRSTTNQDKLLEEMESETEFFNKLTDEEDYLCGASKPIDLVIVNFHMPSTLYRTILHGCRTVTVVTTVTSQHHGSKKGSKLIMSPTTFSRYVGQPVFTSNVGCTDEQYSAVMKIFWAQLNALYQLLEEDLRVNGFVDLGRREKWRPRTSTVHFPVPVPVHKLHYLRHYYQAVCDEIEQRLITPLLSGREEVQYNMYEICSIAFELYEKLLYGVVFTDPVLTQHVALNLFQIYTSEKRIPSSLVKELRDNVHELLSDSNFNSNHN